MVLVLYSQVSTPIAQADTEQPLAPSQPSRDALENPKEHRRNTRHLLNPPRYHDQHSTAVEECVYLVDEEYLVTAFVPSETACLASSPGRMRRTLNSVRLERLVDIESDLRGLNFSGGDGRLLVVCGEL